MPIGILLVCIRIKYNTICYFSLYKERVREGGYFKLAYLRQLIDAPSSMQKLEVILCWESTCSHNDAYTNQTVHHLVLSLLSTT